MHIKASLRYVIAIVFLLVLISLIWTSKGFTPGKHTLVQAVYMTRPLWDAPRKPFKTLPHFFSRDLSIEENCALNKWRPTVLEEENIVLDAILFSVELDLLEIRLRELYDVVDKFLILESNSTFTGLTKPFVFEENRERFAFAMDKIVYKGLSIIVDPTVPDFDPFDIEAKHRVAMNALIEEGGAQPGNWILMMDVDEIPSWHTVKLFKGCDGIPSPIHLQLRNYMYSFEFLVDMESWRGKAVQFPYTYGHGRVSDTLLADAGWHCSFCFKTLHDFQFKMKAYSHADRVHTPKMLELDRIQDVICEGKDIFDMLPEAYTFKDLLTKMGPIPRQMSGLELPKAVLKDSKKFSFLLPGGCIRPAS